MHRNESSTGTSSSEVRFRVAVREQQPHARDARPDAHEQLVEAPTPSATYAAGCDNVTIDGNFMFRPHVHDGRQVLHEPLADLLRAHRNGKVNPVPSGRDLHEQHALGQSGSGRGPTRRPTTTTSTVSRPSGFPSGGNVYLSNEKPPGPELHGRATERLPPRIVQRIRGELPGRRGSSGRPHIAAASPTARGSKSGPSTTTWALPSERGLIGSLAGGWVPDDPRRESGLQLRRAPDRRRTRQLPGHAALLDASRRKHLQERVRRPDDGGAEALSA